MDANSKVNQRLQLTGVGTTQMMLGVISLIVGIQAIFAQCAYGYIAYGIWCGAVFIGCGTTSILAGVEPSPSRIFSTVIVTVAACLFALTQVTFAGVGLSYNILNTSCKSCNTTAEPYCTQWTSIRCFNRDAWIQALFVSSVLIAAALAQFGLCFFPLFSLCHQFTKTNAVYAQEDSYKPSTEPAALVDNKPQTIAPTAYKELATSETGVGPSVQNGYYGGYGYHEPNNAVIHTSAKELTRPDLLYSNPNERRLPKPIPEHW